MSDRFDDLLGQSNEAIQAMVASATRIAESANRIGTSLARRTEEVSRAQGLQEAERYGELVRIADRTADDFNQLTGLLYREGERLTFSVARCVDALLRARAVQEGEEQEEIIRNGMHELVPIGELFAELAMKLGQIQEMLSDITPFSELQAGAQQHAAEVIEHERGQIRAAAEMIIAACGG